MTIHVSLPRSSRRLAICLSLLSVSVIAIAMALPVHAAQLRLSWTADIDTILVDSGTHDFSGTGIGDSFSGSFDYFDVPDAAQEVCVPDSCNWYWNGGGAAGELLPAGGATSGANNSSLSIENDSTVALLDDDGNIVEDDPAALALLNAIAAPDVLAQDQPFDLWQLLTLAQTGPTDTTAFLVAFLSYSDTTIFNDATFRALPPIGIADAAGLVVENMTDTGTFRAAGKLTSVEISAVPVPAAAWLFVSGLLFLGWMRTRYAGG